MEVESTYFNGSVGSNFSGGPPFMPPPMPINPMSKFERYAYPITCIFGIIGNTIVFFVFIKTKLKKPSTARYLAAVAVADTGFLWTILLIKLSQYFDVPIHGVKGPCQLLTFGNYVFPFLSTWYFTAVMVEKYIGVTWPRKKSRMCTVFRAKCIVIALAIVGVVCYLYTTWFFGVDRGVCTFFYNEPRIASAWVVLTRMDSVINFAIPYAVMLILLILISYTTYTYHRNSGSAGARFLRRRRITRPEDKEFKTTPLLIVLCVFTLVFCFPNNSSNLRQVFTSLYIPTEMDMLVTGVFHYIAILNNAAKIIIYIAASSAFFKQIRRLLCVIKKGFRSDNNELETRNEITVTKDVCTFTEGKV